ncbi:hypothetical protein HDV00_005217 [Rhizophlyctis rosea]|nr:hypothetical protein HDV00_005217 [Rhizophlyctis rosea]
MANTLPDEMLAEILRLACAHPEARLRIPPACRLRRTCRHWNQLLTAELSCICFDTHHAILRSFLETYLTRPTAVHFRYLIEKYVEKLDTHPALVEIYLSPEYHELPTRVEQRWGRARHADRSTLDRSGDASQRGQNGDISSREIDALHADIAKHPMLSRFSADVDLLVWSTEAVRLGHRIAYFAQVNGIEL